MQLSNMITDFSNLVGPAGKGTEVSSSGITVWLNDAYDMCKGSIIDAIPDFYTKKATAATIAGQQEYALPSDFEKLTLLSVSYDGSTFVRCLPLNNINQSDNSNSAMVNFSVAQPFYYIIKQKLGLNPIPSVSADMGIKMWYAYDPGHMVEDSDEPDIPVRFQSILKYWAYANYLDQNDEHASAERQRIRFDSQLEKLVQQLADQQVDQSKTVEINEDDQGLYVNEY